MFWKEWVIKRETHKGTCRIPIFVFISIRFLLGAHGYPRIILNRISSILPSNLIFSV